MVNTFPAPLHFTKLGNPRNPYWNVTRILTGSGDCHLCHHEVAETGPRIAWLSFLASYLNIQLSWKLPRSNSKNNSCNRIFTSQKHHPLMLLPKKKPISTGLWSLERLYEGTKSIHYTPRVPSGWFSPWTMSVNPVTHGPWTALHTALTPYFNHTIMFAQLFSGHCLLMNFSSQTTFFSCALFKYLRMFLCPF